MGRRSNPGGFKLTTQCESMPESDSQSPRPGTAKVKTVLSEACPGHRVGLFEREVLLVLYSVSNFEHNSPCHVTMGRNFDTVSLAAPPSLAT
jgi:hypothetical protein